MRACAPVCCCAVGKLLEGRFTPDIFIDDVVYVATRLVPLTISLWNKTQAKMLPTPSKFHYLFNMRELSKVFQVRGWCMTRPVHEWQGDGRGHCRL